MTNSGLDTYENEAMRITNELNRLFPNEQRHFTIHCI